MSTTSSYLDVLNKALTKASALLEKTDALNYDELHITKSILYAAIERTGMKAESLIYSQRLLRELFWLITEIPNLKDYERRAGMQMLDELRQKCNGEL